MPKYTVDLYFSTYASIEVEASHSNVAHNEAVKRYNYPSAFSTFDEEKFREDCLNNLTREEDHDRIEEPQKKEN